jgi:hypothetical protein
MVACVQTDESESEHPDRFDIEPRIDTGDFEEGQEDDSQEGEEEQDEEQEEDPEDGTDDGDGFAPTEGDWTTLDEYLPLDACNMGDWVSDGPGGTLVRSIEGENRLFIGHSHGSEECTFDETGFDWQRSFRFMDAQTFYGGDVMKIECTYDNPGQESVYWGDQTVDEMCLVTTLMVDEDS